MKNRAAFLYTVFILGAVWACGGSNNASGNRANDADPDHNATRTASQIIALSDSIIAYRKGDTVKMGKVRSGEIVKKPLVVRNDGDNPLVIIDVDKTCGCVDLEYPRQPLRKGEQAAMEMELDSRGLTGWIYKTVYIKTSSPSGSYTLVVTAEVE